MKITKLVLNNFSSYENITTFNFNTTDKKPIILIGGQNGAGKTSLFVAIKIALYGPLAFGYNGANSFYAKKIKELINSKAYRLHSCTAGVSIELNIKQDRESRNYQIFRNWTVSDNKFNEDYGIYCNEEKVENDELAYIENYIQTIIPPKLFDFFLFDGEEIGSIFSEDNYNKYLKDALMTMCGIDIYSLIYKFCSTYVDISDDDALKSEYSQCLMQIDNITERITQNEEKIIAQNEAASQLENDVEDLKRQVTRKGGILLPEREKMLQTVEKKDKERAEISSRLKSLMENEIPFVILENFIPEVESQINYEEKASIYEYIQNKITSDFIKDLVSGECDDPIQLSDKLMNAIIRKFAPGSDNASRKLLFDMSRDEISKIENIFNTVSEISKKDLVKDIENKNLYTKQVSIINQKLRESPTDEEFVKLQYKIDRFNENIELLHKEITELNEINFADHALLNELNSKKIALYNQLANNAQNKHVYKLSKNIANIMDEIISDKITAIRNELSTQTIINLKNIYRKDNLVSFIELSDDFKIGLYQNQEYTISELKSLINNIGLREFETQLGSESIAELFQQYNAQSLPQLKEIIFARENDDKINLHKRIELNRLSKGERQIFILSLYWAIIKISEKDIPFIIDTPYARIDANHREEISKKFFPHISKQVIILSTDEEVTQEYYEILKPYISRSYLLNNNVSDNKTTVENKYFFEVL